MSRAWRAFMVALLLGCFFFAHDAYAAGRAECVSIQSKILGRAVPYCVLLPPSYDDSKSQRYPVLYLLHGLGDNDQMLIHSGGINLVQDMWERKELPEMLIVTPDGGVSFYINSSDGKRRYEDFFLQEFIPGVEKRYRARTGRGSRGIGGISMGGYGALHIAFRHPELFVAVGVHSAALIKKLPNVSTAQDTMQAGQLRILTGAFGSPFDAAFWKKNDPVTIVRTANLNGLKIYFDCGSEDDFGFEDGAKSLDKMLASRHIAHEFHLYPGGHDWTYFASHLPAMLQFEGSAFMSVTSRSSKP